MERGHYTKPVDRIERADCEALIRLALAEDAPEGDVTSDSIFAPEEQGHGVLRAREPGVLCGLPVVWELLAIDAESHPAVSLEAGLRDGDELRPGATIGTLSGSLPALLRLERVILNFLQHLSGISTVVRGAVELAGPKIALLDTRKTLPGYRRLDKYAVFVGGGTNHRIHLSEMAMLKDNHIAAAGGIRPAVERVRAARPDVPIEIEVDTFEQLEEALACSPRVVLLDNMRGELLRRAVARVAEYPGGRRPMVELSGGWRPEELAALDLPIPVGVSMGYLTHTTRFLDIGLDFA